MFVGVLRIPYFWWMFNSSPAQETSHDDDPERPSALMMRKMRSPKYAAIGAGLIVVLVALVFTAFRSQQAFSTSEELSETSSSDTGELQSVDDVSGGSGESASQTLRVHVHVVGAVAKPGVYELEASARVIDAIEAAGGANDDADLQQVNMARLLSDGEQIRVLTAQEATLTSQSAVGKSLLNLNSATVDQLEELPGVGPALAARIVDWREANGSFKNVEELSSVSGIGEKLLENVRELVTL